MFTSIVTAKAAIFAAIVRFTYWAAGT